MNVPPASSPVVDFSAAAAVAAGTDFAELQVSEAGLVWNEFRPADGACRLWLWRHGCARCLTPDGYSVRSRVYEYGGGSFCFGGDGVVFVNERDQQVYTQDLHGAAPRALTASDGARYGDLSWHAGRVLAVEEQRGDPVIHRLVAITEAGREVLAEGADFYAAPTTSPDGRRLAWIEWDRPEQPWTRTRLMCRDAEGSARCVADPGASLQQPRFDGQGRLYCLSDQAGFWQPWSERTQGWEALPAEPADHAAAPWQLGASSWQVLGPGAYLATWFSDGMSQLGLRTPAEGLRRIANGYTRLRSLVVDEHYIYAIAASPTRPSAVIAIERSRHVVHVLAGGAEVLPDTRISQPRPFTYASEDAQAHGFFYPAHATDALPPLLVFIHGGPTSACYPVLDPRIQYWTQRGFAVADLNYRGSSGYGRAYRQALHERWGEVDVVDACAAVTYLSKQGLIDADKAFIRGGSAGGYTTLCALAFHRVFRAGASLYGVSDPVALGKATHKFEGDYLDWLIGDPDLVPERYAARTPLLHANRISTPVIFFQGERDAVVVPAQTREMLKALQANGVYTEGHFYPEERHGFRQAENLAHALEAEWRFYDRVLRQVSNGPQ